MTWTGELIPSVDEGKALISISRNGFWDRDEIEAIYGVHHVYSQKKSKVCNAGLRTLLLTLVGSG
jgi:hypothetical protein